MSHFKHYFLNLMLIMGCALTSVTANAENLQCVNTFFSACAQQKELTTVMVTKELLNLTNNTSISSMIDKNILNKINTIGIVTAEKKTDVTKLRGLTNTYLLHSGQFETLMISTDDEEQTRIWKSKEPFKDLNTFVVMTRDADEMTVVVIYGNITISDIAKLKL